MGKYQEGDRRIKLLMVDAAAFMSLFTEGLKVRQGYKMFKGVPKDAVLLGTSIDHATGAPVLAVWSETYENTPLNENFPTVEIHIRPIS